VVCTAPLHRSLCYGALEIIVTLLLVLPAGLRVAQPCRYCFHSMVQKWVFRPVGATRRHVAPINVKFCTCQISRLSGRKCVNTASKTFKIYNFGQKFVPQGRLVCNIFYKIFSICTRLQVAFKFLVWPLSTDKHPNYKHFPAEGAFSHKFSIAPSGETTDRIKKVWEGGGCKNGTDLFYHHAKYGGDPGSRAGCRQKSVMFFCLSVFLSRFGMTKFVITETL